MIHIDQIATKPGLEAKPTLHRPADHLLACHRRIEERLDILEMAAFQLPNRREEALRAMGNVFRFFESNGTWHTADEEDSIFPRLRGRLDDAEVQLLNGLEMEHRQVEVLYADVRDFYTELVTLPIGPAEAMIEPLQNSIMRLHELYRNHISKEDANLIPLIRKILDEDQLAIIAEEMKSRRGLIPHEGLRSQ